MRTRTTSLLAISLMLMAVLFAGSCGGTETAENASNENAPAANSTEAEDPAKSSEATNGNDNSEAADSGGQDEKIKRIEFKPGASSGSAKGTVKGYDRNDHVFRAKKGQKLSVKLKTSSTFAYFNVSDKADGFALEMDPRPLDVTTWDAAAPKDGDYYVRVYLVRAEARRDGKADYTLEVAITGSGASSAPSAKKVDWFECSDRMEVAVMFEETGGKRMATVEVGDTVLRLPATTQMTAEYGDGRDSIKLEGDELTFKYRGKSYTCMRK